MRLKLSNRQWYPHLFLAGCLLAAVVAVFVPDDRWIKAFLSIASAFGGVTYFLYSQHVGNTRLFTELFRDFNKRYDDLNARLGAILRGDPGRELEEDERCTLFDYFNLCAEEFLYYDAGYIDELVWRSWTNGMRVFAANPRIRKLWESEMLTGSYYGFKVPILESPGPVAGD